MSNLRLSKRTGCQYVGYFYYSKNLNWAACGPRAVGWTCWSKLFRQVWSSVQRSL